MSFTGLVGYCWASAPAHSTMEISPSATANSLCTPSSSNDVAGKSVPELQGKARACLPRSLEESFEPGRDKVRGKYRSLCPPRWNNSLRSDVQCHVRSARKEVSELG